MRTTALASTLLASLLFAGCSCEGGLDGEGDAGTGGGGMDGSTLLDGEVAAMDGEVVAIDGAPLGDAGPGVVVTEDGGFEWTCRVTRCGGRVTQCGDCIDNDGDGLIDSRDRECLGPCDNTEGPALLAGVGGETGGPCQSDCYFDFGNGSGNDDCFWDHRCDPLSVAPDFPPEGSRCPYEMSRVGGRTCPDTQSDQCHTVCSPLTPSGCDCFGCCTFDEIADRPTAMGGAHVWIGSVFDGTNEGSCTFADITDTSLCRPCTPVADCFNDCGPCELCIGRTTLPPECIPSDAGVPPRDGAVPMDGGIPARCSRGEQPCGLPSDPACPVDYYCVSGCCQPTLI